MKHHKIILPFVGLVAGFILYVVYRTRPVFIPRKRWRRFSRRDAVALDVHTCQQLQGIYKIEEGKDFFGETAVLKWSYTVERRRTIYHLSFFCEKGGTYIVCEGRRHHNDILLFGHWRKAAANGTGVVKLMITTSGTNPLQNNNSTTWVIEGWYGEGNKKPSKGVKLSFTEPLPQKPPFEILAHRGGARNVDFLPVSENTLAMMKMAARLGATGVEIDVRITKDGVPVIFHDAFLSIHTVDKLYAGWLRNYLLKELRRFRLRKGGRVPTLRQTLHTILYQTPLQTVWLDIKNKCDLQCIVNLQREYMQRAAAIGRELFIYIGIPDKTILDCFTSLDDYLDIPSLTELELDVALAINAEAWAPQYTNGFQKQAVGTLHAINRKAFVWSLDSKFMIDWFISEGRFDGLVTNAPSVAAHWYYTVEEKKLQGKEGQMEKKTQ